MNLAEHLRRQFAYDDWANREVLTTIRSGGADERSVELLAHILSAERLWLERLKQQPQSSPVWPKTAIENCAAEIDGLRRAWHDFLGNVGEDELGRTVSYTNSKGEPWSSTILDVLTHVTMHSAYHRGQIASHMRARGKAPAYTDFIHAVRQKRIG